MLITRSATFFPSITVLTLLTMSLILGPFPSVEILFIIPYASVIAVGSGVVTIIASSAPRRKVRTFCETPAAVSMRI